MAVATLTLKECLALVGVGSRIWVRWVREGRAPQPINPQDRKTLWSRAAVLRFVGAC